MVVTMLSTARDTVKMQPVSARVHYLQLADMTGTGEELGLPHLMGH